MNRRKSLKTLLVGGASASVLAQACKLADKPDTVAQKEPTASAPASINRMPEEASHDQALAGQHFFTQNEILVITLLGDILIPRDDFSGSASEAGVPAFIDFIVQEKPEFQTPLRGGIRWLDLKSLAHFEKPFATCSPSQQLELVDLIAWPKKAKPENQQGVAFFNLLRNLVASGFYTSPMGLRDVGYLGNTPNQWNGVPEEVLRQYNLEYSEKEIRECVRYS